MWWQIQPVFLANPAVVSYSRHDYRPADTSTQMVEPSEVTSQWPSPSSTITTPAGRLDYVRQRLVNQRFLHGSADVTCLSWSCGMGKQYEAT